jgi:hypothetical protein
MTEDRFRSQRPDSLPQMSASVLWCYRVPQSFLRFAVVAAKPRANLPLHRKRDQLEALTSAEFAVPLIPTSGVGF